MTTKDEILQALQPIIDPQYGKGIVQLNLVRDMMVKEDSVSLTYVTTKDDEAYKQAAREEVERILRGLGINQVHIRFRMISDHERSQLGEAAVQPSSEPAKSAQAQSAGTSLLSPHTKVQFIAVASGKGGVGKSTVTVNLAVALARKGKKVGIIDADIYGFSVPDMMGVEEQPQLVGSTIIPVKKFGVEIISMGFFVQDNAPVIWRGPMLGKMLRNFFSEVTWGELDYLLLDLPPGTGDVALDVHQMLPQSKEIIVTTPHATAAFVAARAGAMAAHTNHEILGVVENMAYYECGKCGEKEFIFGKGGGAKLAEELHTELLAQIPLGAPDNHSSEADYSPSVYKESTKVGQIYLEMADNIIAKTQ